MADFGRWLFCAYPLGSAGLCIPVCFKTSDRLRFRIRLFPTYPPMKMAWLGDKARDLALIQVMLKAPFPHSATIRIRMRACACVTFLEESVNPCFASLSALR